ncbi:MAG TPA: isocitrate/isopropylmalate dehydrogenase family protein [Accumulibacter sp.]|uniref:isocitrate/isopropylmalate dehydrogenase family protein n=1 Tax=Accumulibacter sp. TaxID=2053492 RepID=UPI0025E8886C|nr:isocitrate/isopropylmalate dehydrogenase family protein [Accumulibacter sp.]MCM8599839.1 isocitrate/isopropylmalate dehydrogenase family protein [Accumulibacter sp.]MCM8662718.1 isocitrate/isopropylmalate dehydrogenase family protein [Accumulibacter sp.]HNC52907.1 isocitrate/isopropylmalate dehydrogenase family protein [Accumulibacter sp.]
MKRDSRFRIAVIPGDGIGPEIVGSCLQVLEVLRDRLGGVGFDFRQLEGGAGHYQKAGAAFSAESMAECKKADAVLFGAIGLPDVRYPDGTEISTQFDLRFEMDLYAGLRPIRSYPSLPRVLADKRAVRIDLVLVREQTEGLLYSHRRGTFEDDVAWETMRISREGSRRVAEFAFRLAERRAKTRRRAGKVTCVDKANVLSSMAFFRKVFSEVAASHPQVSAEYAYVDATAMKLVKAPWEFDVLVTENAFGGILSDLSAGVVGSLGLAPSADIGERHAVFQPAHGSAPDIAGKGVANPIAQILSAALMLDWLADQHGEPRLAHGARILEHAVDKALTVVCPIELGGQDGTVAITKAIMTQIRKA